jgi:hypothetical protein
MLLASLFMARSMLFDVANQLAMEVQGEGRVYIRIRKRRQSLGSFTALDLDPRR